MDNIPVGACVISSGWGAAGAEYGQYGWGHGITYASQGGTADFITACYELEK